MRYACQYTSVCFSVFYFRRLSQELRRVEEKLFFFPYNDYMLPLTCSLSAHSSIHAMLIGGLTYPRHNGRLMNVCELMSLLSFSFLGVSMLCVAFQPSWKLKVHILLVFHDCLILSIHNFSVWGNPTSVWNRVPKTQWKFRGNTGQWLWVWAQVHSL